MQYAELHCRSNFSFLEAASQPEELVERAADLGYRALAITDRESLAGVVRAHTVAKERGIQLLIGAEVFPQDSVPLVLWATDRASYGRLCRLLTVGRRRAEKGKCKLWFDDVAEYAAGLLAGISLNQHQILTSATKSPRQRNQKKSGCSKADTTLSALHQIAELFGDRGYLLAELHYSNDDAQTLNKLTSLSKQTQLPLVAAGNVRYHCRARQPLYEVLTAIRLGTTVDKLHLAEPQDQSHSQQDSDDPLALPAKHRLPNAEWHLRSLADLAQVYDGAEELLGRTVAVAERCQFSLDELRYEYPTELAPAGETPFTYLTRMTWQGANKRYPEGIPNPVRKTIAHELQLICELKYEAYFLTVFDLVRFARRRGILCQGRGSAANSAVCFCLGISSVDPGQIELLFERFVSKERDEAPDIDVDFEHQRREEVLQYLYEKYGRESAGLTAVVITYRTRSAIRDVGKALGLSLDRVDALAKHAGRGSSLAKLPQRFEEVGIDPESEIGQRFLFLLGEILGFPRHLSQHVGGMVMTRGPLCELVPIENASMPDRTVVQWDKDDLDALGVLKVDCLCLGMLSAIRRALTLLEDHYGRRLNLATVPQEDPQVYDMICAADTIGVFQIESRAQMSMLPRLKPRTFYDLVIEIAIVRPGPIQGQMVHPYLRRRSGLEEATYPNKEIRQVLEKTLGVPIFQEQAMRLAVVAAGFTPGEADQLRRAMAAWRRPGLIDQFERKLIDGMRARGLSDEFAAQVFNQIRGFGEYGFPESHAASFSLLVYVSAWLKCHYPAVFAAAILNSQPMGFYAPAQLVRDARQHGVAVRPIDVNYSDWDCTLELSESLPVNTANTSLHSKQNQKSKQPKVLRLGMRLLSGWPQELAERLVENRKQHGLFQSQNELSRRLGLSRSWMTRLAEADALASLERSRRQALWEALSQDNSQDALPLLTGLTPEDEPSIPLPISTTAEEVFSDYRTTGLSLKGHPLAFLRGQLESMRVSPIAQLDELPHGRAVQVAGVVLLRQRPSTAKGITFVTLEDETGAANLVIHPKVWDRLYTVARGSSAWLAAGELQKEGRVIHVVVSQLFDLAKHLHRDLGKITFEHAKYF